MTYHLAQINIARLLAPMDSPQIKEFRDFIEPINKLGESSPGFVWRLQDDSALGGATEIETPFEDDMIIVNMTVWESIEALKTFTYSTVHSYFVKNRKKWFERASAPHLVLWWVPLGHVPSLAEAKEKLELIEAKGPNPLAFTFSKQYDPEGNQI
jgi:hypothetical protein